MNIPYGSLPDSWLWISSIGMLLILLSAIYHAPWSQLRNNEPLHVFLGVCVGLMIMWTIRASTIPGLDYHYLGATLLLLMFGWSLGVIGVCIILLATLISGTTDWRMFGLNALVMGVLPVSISYLIYRLVKTYLPQGFFIYLFLCAFLGAGITVMLSHAAAAAILLAAGVYTTRQLLQHYFPMTPLLAFPEAFITGTLITTMTMLRPHWIASYQEMNDDVSD